MKDNKKAPVEQPHDGERREDEEKTNETTALVVASSANVTCLHDFIENHVLPIDKNYIDVFGFRSKNIQLMASLLLLGVGASYGVPWINASEKAASVFPEGMQASLKPYFAFGIVTTVGFDGLFFMLTQIERFIRPKSTVEQNLCRRDDALKMKAIKYALSFFLPVFGCIAPVYAAYEYSDRLLKSLVVVVALNVYAGGLFGYLVLIDGIIQRYKAKKDPDLRMALYIQSEAIQQLTQRINSISGHDVANTVLTVDDFLNFLNTRLNNVSHPVLMRCQQSAQLTLSLLIALTSTAVTFFLSREAFEKYLHVSQVPASIMAVFSELPSFVITLVSSYEVFGKLLKTPTRPEKPADILKPLVVFLLALGAPSAGTYITYETMKSHLPFACATIAAMSVLLARVTFSAFTQLRLAEKVINAVTGVLAVMHQGQAQTKTVQAQLVAFRSGVREANPKYLSQLSFLSNHTAAVNDLMSLPPSMTAKTSIQG